MAGPRLRFATCPACQGERGFQVGEGIRSQWRDCQTCEGVGEIEIPADAPEPAKLVRVQ